MLQWTLIYNCLFKSLLSILLDIHPEIKSVNYMVILCFIFFFFLRSNHTDFYEGCRTVCSHQQCTGVLISLHLHRHIFSVLIIGWPSNWVLSRCFHLLDATHALQHPESYILHDRRGNSNSSLDRLRGSGA